MLFPFIICFNDQSINDLKLRIIWSNITALQSFPLLEYWMVAKILSLRLHLMDKFAFEVYLIMYRGKWFSLLHAVHHKL